jgi:transcriptional regulator with XRE-family HTH domain
MKEDNWQGCHIRAARKLLKLEQREFGLALGWTGKQQVSDLERGYKGKALSVQTALAIECLLRRKGKWHEFIKMVALIKV